MVMDKITSFRMEWRGMAVNPAICWVHCHSKVGSLTDRLLIGRSGCACVCVCLYSLPRVAPRLRAHASLSLYLHVVRPASLSLYLHVVCSLSLHAFRVI